MAESPVEEFARLVNSLHEVEYGDFKRKVGSYLNRLEETLSSQTKSQLQRNIEEIRRQVVFDPEPDVEKMRRKILSLAGKMKNAVQ